MPFTDNRAGERCELNHASAIGLWATHAGKAAEHSVFDMALLFWLVGTVGMGYKRDACGMHLG